MDVFQRRLHVINWPRDKYKSEYSNLIKMMNSREPCIIFIGAGPSKNIYGDWPELVDYIISNYTISLTQEEEQNKTDHAPAILDKCQSNNRNLFYMLLRQKFSVRKDDFRPVHFDLLSLPTVGFITTNIDMCLVNAAQRLKGNNQLNGFNYYPDHLEARNLSNRYLFHIHGIITNHKGEDTIEYTVLTESDYKQSYPNNIQPFLWSAFNEINIIFIGFSGRDPEIKNVLDHAKEEQRRLSKLPCDRISKEVKHYIFLPSIFQVDGVTGKIQPSIENEDNEDNYYLKTYNLHVIRYKVVNNEHTEINHIVSNLNIETTTPLEDRK